MAAPPKPWERVGVNYQNNVTLPSNSMAGSPLGGESLHNTVGGASASPLSTSTSPPQLPPRPSQQSTYANRYGGGSNLGYGYAGGSSFGNPYSFGGGYGGYSGYGGGMYNSPYSSYGGGYNSPQHVTSSFARQAEDSSRPAFESIESIVQAVTSVGMMLDSTFSAVYNSFRAVIGVADNFARLKSQLIQVFSALAFIRSLRYMLRKLLELLRLRPKGEAEAEWKKAFNAAVSTSPDGSPKKSSWPILLFFGIVMGGPYVIWKLISKFSGPEDCGWASGQDDHFVGKANFNFQGQGSEELSFSAGQEIKIAPKELQPKVRGWLLGSVDGSTTGLLPANYVSVLGKKRGQRPTPQQPHIQMTPEQNRPSVIGSPFPSSGYPQIEEGNNDGREFDSYFSGSGGTALSSQLNLNESGGGDDKKSSQEAADILEEADKC